jgi:hypothetical protein
MPHEHFAFYVAQLENKFSSNPFKNNSIQDRVGSKIKDELSMVVFEHFAFYVAQSSGRVPFPWVVKRLTTK